MVEKITDNSDENTFHQLTSQSATLEMPLFQRRYVWTKKQLERMFAEMTSVVEDAEKSRFIGAVIAVRRLTNPSQPDRYEVVDGQQQLTTLYLILLATAQLAAKTGNIDYAKGLIGTNMYIDWVQEAPYNTKLVPSIEDRPQFRSILEHVIKTGDLEKLLSSRIEMPYGGDEKAGPLTRQFTTIKAILNKRYKESGFAHIERLVDAARNGLTFVFILLKDPGSATTVFDGLNDPGTPISVGDLVKNEVFARTGYDAEDAKHLHDSMWVPFFAKFGHHFNDYFFPYAVIQKPNTNKTDMFKNLRETWKELDSGQIIQHLQVYADPFLALHGRSEELGRYVKQLRNTILNLHRLRQPSAALPFEMKLLEHFQNGAVSLDEVVKIFELLEAFFVRRALCGVEPTGLLGMFRTMWSNMDGHPTAEKAAGVILRRQTVEWPTDARLQEQISQRALFSSSVARYVIYEHDKSFEADPGDYDRFTIEHILPQAITQVWEKTFSRPSHATVKDLWANLLPMTAEMNMALKQSPYAKKRGVFENDSMFASTRKFAQKFDDWNEDTLAARTSELFEFAVVRWPRPQKPAGQTVFSEISHDIPSEGALAVETCRRCCGEEDSLGRGNPP